MTPLKHLAYRAISRACATAGKQAGGAGSRILLYHSVGGRLASDPYGTSISPARFHEHLQALSTTPGWRFSAFARPSAARRDLVLCFDDGYRDTLTTAAPALQRLGLPMTVFVTSGFVAQPGELYLTPHQLKELAALPGVLIGSHGARHRRLTELQDSELAEELASSRKRLEDWIGRRVDALSYPHGAVDRRVRDAAQAAGYGLAGCSTYGLNAAGRDPLLLKRTEITAWDTACDVALKVSGAWDWFARRRPDPAAK